MKRIFERGQILGNEKPKCTKLLHEHTDGPLPDGHFHIVKQYRKYDGRVTFSVCKNDCTFICNNYVYKIVNVAVDSDQKIYFVSQRYLEKKDFFTDPIESSHVGIFSVAKLSSELEFVPLENVYRKCMLLQCDENICISYLQ